MDKHFTFLPRNTELRRWNNLLHAYKVNHRHRSPSSLLESTAANTMKWVPKRSYFYYLQREPQKNFIQKAFMKLSYVILGATGIQNQNSYLNRLQIFHSPNSICFSAAMPCGGRVSRNRFHYIIFSCFNTWSKHVSSLFHNSRHKRW